MSCTDNASGETHNTGLFVPESHNTLKFNFFLNSDVDVFSTNVNYVAFIVTTVLFKRENLMQRYKVCLIIPNMKTIQSNKMRENQRKRKIERDATFMQRKINIYGS